MSKSIVLTKEMRKDIANKLMVQAVAKHGPKLAAKFEKLNKQFWEQHTAKVDKVLKIERKRWPELIQAGVLNATVQIKPYFIDDEAKKQGASISGKKNPIKLSIYHEHKALIVLESPTFSGVSKYLTGASYSRHDLVLNFVNQEGSVPYVRGMEELDSKMLATAQKLNDELNEVINAACEFREQVAAVLASCRTSRQLEDLLPEAAKLIQKPATERKDIVPIEAANAIRDQLKAGVPPIGRN